MVLSHGMSLWHPSKTWMHAKCLKKCFFYPLFAEILAQHVLGFRPIIDNFLGVDLSYGSPHTSAKFQIMVKLLSEKSIFLWVSESNYVKEIKRKLEFKKGIHMHQ